MDLQALNEEAASHDRLPAIPALKVPGSNLEIVSLEQLGGPNACCRNEFVVTLCVRPALHDGVSCAHLARTDYAVPQLEWTPGRGYVEPLRGGGEWGNFAGAPMGAGCSRPPSRRSRSTASSGARLRFRGLRVSWTSAPPSCASGSGSSSRGRTRP